MARRSLAGRADSPDTCEESVDELADDRLASRCGPPGCSGIIRARAQCLASALPCRDARPECPPPLDAVAGREEILNRAVRDPIGDANRRRPLVVTPAFRVAAEDSPAP